MADDLTYADLQPIDDRTYQNLYTVVSRRNQTYGLGDVNTQVFKQPELDFVNYLKENPLLDLSTDEGRYSFYEKEAPNFAKYYLLPKDTTFEGAVADAAVAFEGDYKGFYESVNQVITSGKYGELNPDSAATYRGFATNVFDEYQAARNKEQTYDRDWWGTTTLGKRGIPSPLEYYNPKSFPKYAAWEKGIKERIAKQFPQYANNPAIDAAIEKRAIQIMSDNKRTPFHDALLREEAMK